jgi:putative ABC transport system permease protein
VWRVSVAAVRRRRFQSVVLGVVVLCSSVAIVMALGLLEATSAPFDRAFERQRGAHVVATFDTTEVSGDRLLQAARRSAAGSAAGPSPGSSPGPSAGSAVESVAGPFGQVVVTVAGTAQSLPPGPLAVVGRPGPGGPVDRVDLWAGRWAAAPGQIVVNRPAEPFFRDLLGATVELEGGTRFTIVGLAGSLSRSAEAWVTPDQLQALRSADQQAGQTAGQPTSQPTGRPGGSTAGRPASAQMLLRFTTAETDGDLRAAMAALTPGLPAGSLLDSQTYLAVKRDVARTASVYVPFLTVFGVLGLAVAVLIIANVISGAVVAGLRHIGVLKSVGFTPHQVVAVYLGMVLLPGFAGCLAGPAGAAAAGRHAAAALGQPGAGAAVRASGPLPAVAGRSGARRDDGDAGVGPVPYDDRVRGRCAAGRPRRHGGPRGPAGPDQAPPRRRRDRGAAARAARRPARDRGRLDRPAPGGPVRADHGPVPARRHRGAG